MGHFYTNVTLKGPSMEILAAYLNSIQRVAVVARTATGFTVVYDQQSERQDGSAYPFLEELTQALNCLALYVTNHDDSVLYYRLYQAGAVLDNYDSSPNYFDGQPVPPAGGNAEILCNAFGAPGARERVNDILRYDMLADENEGKDRYVFEVDRHSDLVDALGLPGIAVGYGYRYLANDEWPKGLAVEDMIATGEEDG
jgi:hypothetical protein